MAKTLDISYIDPWGVWEVSTEGDEEDRSRRHLGYYEGNVDTIALMLANKALYKLTFKRIDNLIKNVPEDAITTANSVHVAFDIDSGTWLLTDKQIAITHAFKDRPVQIEDGTYYASFKIVDPAKRAEKAKKKIRDMLDGMTDDEVNLLQEELARDR